MVMVYPFAFIYNMSSILCSIPAFTPETMVLSPSRIYFLVMFRLGVPMRAIRTKAKTEWLFNGRSLGPPYARARPEQFLTRGVYPSNVLEVRNISISLVARRSVAHRVLIMNIKDVPLRLGFSEVE